MAKPTTNAPTQQRGFPTGDGKFKQSAQASTRGSVSTKRDKPAKND